MIETIKRQSAISSNYFLFSFSKGKIKQQNLECQPNNNEYKYGESFTKLFSSSLTFHRN